jgi:AcrR family transcriptional regulator
MIDPKITSSTRRKYRGTVQAEVAALTRQRIIEAALALLDTRWVDQITLEEVANRAGVTVQTIIRHFGSKDGLFSAAGCAANDYGALHRLDAPVGDVPGAVFILVEHYEAVGDRIIRVLAQRGRYPEIDTALDERRLKHRQWVERVFAPNLADCEGPGRVRLLAQLVAICDVHLWKMLRRDGGLSREQTETALQEMITALFQHKALPEPGGNPVTTDGTLRQFRSLFVTGDTAQSCR